jgi:hypothetical protein
MAMQILRTRLCPSNTTKNIKGNLMGRTVRKAPKGSTRAPILLSNCFPWVQNLFEKRSFTAFDGRAHITDFKQQILAFAISKFNNQIQQLLKRKLSSKSKTKLINGLTQTDKESFDWSACSPTGLSNTLMFIKDEHYVNVGPANAEPSTSSRKSTELTSENDTVNIEPASGTAEEEAPPEVMLWKFSQTLGPTESQADDVSGIMNGCFVDKASGEQILLSAKQILAAAEIHPPWDPSEPHWWDDEHIQQWLSKNKKDLSKLWPLLVRSTIPTSNEFDMVLKKAGVESQRASTRDAFNDDVEQRRQKRKTPAEDTLEEGGFQDDEIEAERVRERDLDEKRKFSAKFGRRFGLSVVDQSASGADEALEAPRKRVKVSLEEFKNQVRRGH